MIRGVCPSSTRIDNIPLGFELSLNGRKNLLFPKICIQLLVNAGRKLLLHLLPLAVAYSECLIYVGRPEVLL